MAPSSPSSSFLIVEDSKFDTSANGTDTMIGRVDEPTTQLNGLNLYLSSWTRNSSIKAFHGQVQFPSNKLMTSLDLKMYVQISK